jgi:hypothetical protein
LGYVTRPCGRKEGREGGRKRKTLFQIRSYSKVLCRHEFHTGFKKKTYCSKELAIVNEKDKHKQIVDK